MEEMVSTENSWEKKRKEMFKRLKSMDSKNALVKQAVIRANPEKEKGYDDEWMVVDELMFTARAQCRDGKSFEKVVYDLANALFELSGDEEETGEEE